MKGIHIMSSILNTADCCQQASLVKVKEISMFYRDIEILYQCQHCQQYWLYHFHENMMWPQEEDITETLKKISQEESKSILT